MTCARLMNGADLAYLGDAVWEVIVRRELLARGLTSLKDLNEVALTYVSAEAHARIVQALEARWTEEEKDFYRRGRNGAPKKHHRKGLDRGQYLESSGFEALVGALYVDGKLERLASLTQDAFAVIEEQKNE